MEKMNDLRDLLKHEIQDLYSAEDQIIAAMPAMIEKAKNPELKRSLQEHLRITEQQRQRLNQITQKLEGGQQAGNGTENKGLFARLMARRHTCKGMEGIIEEGQKILKEDMNPEVMDAAIIACSQKIEHYEICGYGTAKAFAQELNLTEVVSLLDQTLQEEYHADELLTALAVGRLNREAEAAGSGTKGAKSGGAAAGQSGSTSRSEGGRAGSRERARIDEPEMELANRNRTAGTASRTAGASGGALNRSSAPAGRTTSPSSSSASRGETTNRAGASKGVSGTGASAARGAKGTTKTSGRNSGSTNGRGGSAKGGNNRSR